MRTLFAIAATLTLCACANLEEITAQQDATCRSYGIYPGSDEYARCRMALDQRRFEQAQARSQMIQQQVRATEQLQAAQAQAFSNAANRNRQVNCITNAVGDNAYTSCQ